MSAVTNWTDLMAATVTVKALSAYSTKGDGSRSYSTASASYTARVVEKPTRVLDRFAQEQTAMATMWLATTVSIGLDAQVTYNGSTYEILSVGAFSDEAGLHHRVLFVR